MSLRVLVRGNATTVALPASGRLTLGRGEDNDVTLDDASVSRRHAVLHMGPPLRIEDLGSANGVIVSTLGATDTREPATQSQHRVPTRGTVDLAVGDQLQLGATTVLVQHAAPAVARIAEPRATFAAPVVRDPSMVELYEVVQRVAPSALGVLIQGETGAGKEVLAQAIHAASTRADGPLVAFNCAALSPTLLESELFGYEKGAFTGATTGKAGLLESAHGGTVFLDEVGEMSAGAQAKLLRVLETHAVLRVGGTRPRPIDVRFVAATHRDLEAESTAGVFRHDLYFRLSGVVLTVPPLRERPGEILALAALFATRALQGRTAHFTLAASDALRAHPWPGNVRELRNVVERAVLLASGAPIEPAHLFPQSTRAKTLVPEAPRAAPDATLPRFHTEVAALERRRILEALERCGGNQTRAAALLGISRRTLVARLGEYGVPRPRKRSEP